MIRAIEFVEACCGVFVAGALAVVPVLGIAWLAFTIGTSKGRDGDLTVERAVLGAVLIIFTAAQCLLFRYVAKALNVSGTHPVWRATHSFAHGNELLRKSAGLLALLNAIYILALSQLWIITLNFRHPDNTTTTLELTTKITVLVGSMFAFNLFVTAALRAWNSTRKLARYYFAHQFVVDVLISLTLFAIDIPGRIRNI